MPTPRLTFRGVLLSLFLCGASAGWLAGLSATPILATVLSALLGALVGIISVKSASRVRIGISDPRPLAALFVGLALVAPLGILARTHGIFDGPNLDARQMSTDSEADELDTKRRLGVMFGEEASEGCDRLLALPSHQLKQALETSRSKFLRTLADEIDEADGLEAVVRALCVE